MGRRRPHEVIFAVFRISQAILAAAIFFTVIGNVPNFSIDESPPFALVVWAMLPLCFVTLAYVAASSIVRFHYGGWYFIFYYYPIKNPFLFGILGAVLDLCFAGAFAATIYVQVEVDTGDRWGLYLTGFDCGAFSVDFAAAISAQLNATTQLSPKELHDAEDVLKKRCNGFLVLFVFSSMICLDFVIFAFVRLFYTKPIEPLAAIPAEVVFPRRRAPRVVGP